MCKEWILSEDEKQKRIPIKRNREKRQNFNKVANVADSTNYLSEVPMEVTEDRYKCGETLISSQCSQSIDSNQTNLCNPDNDFDNLSNSVHYSHTSNTSQCFDEMSDISDGNSQLNIDNYRNNFEYSQIPNIVYQKTIDLEFTQIPIRQNMSENDGKTELNELEYNKITELLIATAILRDPLPGITFETAGFVDVFKMADRGIRNLIKCFKKLSPFRNLCQQDQFALFKAGCCEIMLLRSVNTVNFDIEYCQIVTVCNYYLLSPSII